MDINQRVYERFVDKYTSYELWPPERMILERFESQWHNFRMLDLGVGTGRTAYTFAPLTKKYVGIDYIPAMIDMCKHVCGESDSVHFYVCDARDLTRFPDNSFDFVLFSWNGIDAVPHDGRKKIFMEVHRVLQKDGYFFFSTHSLNSIPFPMRLPVVKFRVPLRSIYRWVQAAYRALRMKWLYRNIDINAIKEQQYAILPHPDHRFQLKVYFINPEYQLRQLHDAGFDAVSVYDRFGKTVDPKKKEDTGYLYFLCKPI